MNTTVNYFLAVFLLGALSSSAQVHNEVSTYFPAIGQVAGGCGVPPQIVETQDYVALNVFNTPGDYREGVFDRNALNLSDPKIGEYKKGRNCGRWVRVTILGDCKGIAGCTGDNINGVADKYNGAQLNMLVTDACTDGNVFCRDLFYHLDLHQTALRNFEKNGTPIGDEIYNGNYNNRRIEWEYIEAPNYKGDINIYMIQAAEQYYVPILINNLKNGIHKVEQKVGNNWITADMRSDQGQIWELRDKTQPYTIRITDASDKIINNGREYTFGFPASCGAKCLASTTKLNYTIFNPSSLSIPDSKLELDNTVQVVLNGTNANLLFQQATIGSVEILVIDLLGKEIYRNSFQNISEGSLISIGDYKTGLYKIIVNSNQRVVAKPSFWISK